MKDEMNGGCLQGDDARGKAAHGVKDGSRNTKTIRDRFVRPFLGFARCWSILIKVRLLLLGLIVVPSIAGLILLESDPAHVQSLFIIALVGGLALQGPLSGIVANYLVLNELREVERFCRRLKGGHYHARFELPPQQDEERDMLVLKRNLNWMAHVISRREMQLEEELAKTHKDRGRYISMSMMDPLTGLFNRRGLESALVERAHEAATTNRPLSMLFLDADRFKSVNDTYGHQVGDELLRNLGGIIRANVRENVDVPFRYGGDEFGVLLVGIDLDKAVRIAERILRAFRGVRIGEAGLSIGVSRMENTEAGHLADAQALLAAADQAAYAAKRVGGNRVHVTDKDESV